MVKKFNKFAATADGYRGKRAIVEQRIIEGLEQTQFENGVFNLDATCAQTQYLNNNNMAAGYYMILPKANDIWNNWQVCIINDSSNAIPIYYYSEDLDNLHLFKEISAGNMGTCILVDNSTEEGTWTTLRTVDTISADTTEKYTSNVFETYEIAYNNINSLGSNDIELPLGTVLSGTAIRSIYIKPTEKFIGSTQLTLSIGIDGDTSKFFDSLDITSDITDTNFSKDLFEEILSTSQDVMLKAYIKGNSLSSLTAGKVKIVIEKAKLIDPTILKNAIVNTTVPIGTIMPYAFNDVPTGYIRLDGSVLDNAAQTAQQFVEKLNECNNQLVGEKLIVGSDEWNQIYNTYGSCGKFCWIGSNLRFPAINCFIRGLSDLTQLGKFEDDKIRTITGKFISGQAYPQEFYAEGAFKVNTNIRYHGDGDSAGGNNYGIQFDTTLLGNNFSGSETAPKCVKYPYVIAVFNKTQWTSTLDYNELLNASVNKADVNLSNVISPDANFISKMISIQAPDYSAGVAKSAQQTYTAETDGWLLVNIRVRSGQVAYITINNSIVVTMAPLEDKYGINETIAPMYRLSKGDTYSLTGSITTVFNYTFFPCKRY